MHACIQSTRDLERLAIHLDGGISARDAALAKVSVSHQAKVAAIEADNKKRVDNAKSTKTNEEQLVATERAQVKNMINSVATSGGFANYEALELSDVPTPSDSGPEIAQMIRQVVEVVNHRQQKVNEFQTVFGQGQALGIVVLFGLLLAFVAGFVLSNSPGGGIVGLIAAIVLVATIYVRRTEGLATARAEVRSLCQSLKRRNLREGELVQEKADAAFKAQSEEHAAQHKAASDAATGENADKIAHIKAEFASKKAELDAQVNGRHQKLQAMISALNSGLACGDWKDSAWESWEPTQTAPGCLRIGTITPHTPRFWHHFGHLARLAIPALVDYEAGKGIVIYADGALEDARQMAQSSITRLLGTVPPAGVKFTFLDPVSLGGNVAGFMKLEKYEASLIGGKAWSDARHIETALAEVTDHMETVIQKYLREDFKSIAQYNANARVKEAYRVVIAFDFPVNFSETAAKRLNSIMRNGPRCGVFPIVIVDRSKPMPYGINLEDLQMHALTIQSQQ